MDPLPDYPQALVGYRLWMVRHGLLTSAMFHLPDIFLGWNPGVNQAKCYVREMARHRLSFWQRQREQAEAEERPWDINARNEWYALMREEQERWQHMLALAAHEPPHPECQCGLYAYRDMEYALARYRESLTQAIPKPKEAFFIIGAVALWGKVELYQDGIRARYGAPLAFLRPPSDQDTHLQAVTELAEKYHIPVVNRAELATVQVPATIAKP